MDQMGDAASKKLFLAAHFAGVIDYFESFLGGTLSGKVACFIPTASRVEKIRFYVNASKKALRSRGVSVTELDVSLASTSQIISCLDAADFIFVEGGNTFYLLQELRRSGADQLIIQQVNHGKPYVGISAGAMILSNDIGYSALMDNPQKGPKLNEDYSGLGLVDFLVVPHYNNIPFKKACRKIIDTYGDSEELVLVSNNQAVTLKGQLLEYAQPNESR